MITLIAVICSVLVVTNCQESRVLVIGSKYIRPKQPYTAAFANPLSSNVKLKVALRCDDIGFRKDTTLQLNRHSGKSISFDVPDIDDSQCSFSAVNDGGKIKVNHEVELVFPTKTLSIFILPDKPIYKPGDMVRFRVVVVDIAMKPASHIKSIEIDLEDSTNESKRRWMYGQLRNGIFESSYRMPSVPEPGMWTITVKAKDNSVENMESQQFEVRKYVLPKFVVKVAPSRTLLIDDEEISFNVASHFTFGGPVQGTIRVELFTDLKFPRAAHSEERTFDSNALFTFRLKSALIPDDDKDHVIVRVNVNVTEKFSKLTTFVTKEIPVFHHPYKITLIKPAMHYRPGANYFCKLSVKDHNGIPVEGRSITLKTDTDIDETANLNKLGMASFTLMMPEGDDNVTISAEFEDVEYDNIAVIVGQESTSTQYLHVYTKNRIIPGKKVTFTVSSNEPFTQLSYFIVSRGSIVFSGHQKLSRRKSYSLQVNLSADMAPLARLLVYTVNDGQLIMDFFEMDFESFGNQFEFMLDDETYRPHQDIYVDFSAEKDSFVAFQAIDQGALLLGHDEFGLTKKHVLQDLNKFVEDDENSMDLVHSFGLFSRFGDKANDDSNRMRRSVERTKRQIIKNPIFLRIDFPEAWLWENVTMKNKPSNSITDLVPDTITSWYVTGFALSPTRGLGLMSAPKKFSVGKTFYMIANLPYSIKRGEVARIQITLFNFLGTSLTTDLTLFNKNDEIDFVDRKSNDTKRRKKAIVVPTHQPESIAFLIKAKKIGEIAIKIEATNGLVSDGLEHMLRVIPESRERIISEPRFIELPTRSTKKYKINCNIPQEADEGSTKISVIIDPPLLASLVKNFDTLLASPTGGADLNLKTFIPNVVVLDYLKETETAADFVEQKAKDYLSSGYLNQLKYKNADGSFSQWNPPKDKSSIFLTTLVANAFTTASKYIKVDPQVIKDAYSWVFKKQKNDGCFQEEGEVIYPPMQDNSSSFALTAFIVAAVKENDQIASQFSSHVEKAVKYLAKNFDSLTKLHDIAVVTYALSLTEHPNRKKYLDRLVLDSNIDEKGRYWNEELNIEVAAYALLAYIAQSGFMDARPVMEWLNSQRYSTGDFAGAQSTYVALKALGKMAARLNPRANDYRVSIKYNQNISTFDVSQMGPMESIKLDLPNHVRVFEFDFAGIGYSYFQLTYQYHLNIQVAKHHTFTLNVEVLSTSSYNVQDLRVCVTYKAKEAYQHSGTTLVEVYLPSGLEVSEHAVRDSSRQIKNYERAHGNTAMFVYYTALSSGNQVCFEVTAHRKFKIAMQRPSYVVVYDTNNREHFGVKEYEGKILQICDICDADDCKSMSC